jgi:hypothetical protein
MKLDVAVEHVAQAEQDLADALLKLGERHKSDHDAYHLTRMLERWSQTHLAALQPFAERYEADIDDARTGEGSGPLAGLRENGAELTGRRPEGGLLLLRDVRQLHLLAAAASIDWTILGQAAQAAKASDLLDCVSRCHPETLRTLRWTVTKLKESAPQALTS